MRFVLILVFCIVVVVCVVYMRRSHAAQQTLFGSLTSLDCLSKVLPQSVDALESKVKQALYKAQVDIACIISIQDDKRTYENTFAAFDTLIALSDLAILRNMVEVIEALTPIDTLREAAHKISIEIRSFFVEQVMHNKNLFEALKAYVEGNGKKASLTDEQRYFITETMQDFEWSGLLLPEATRKELLTLEKELTQLCADFAKNIAAENRTIAVSREALLGLDDQFIDALKRSDTGEYLLGVDYPTFFKVMEQCAVEDTRMQLFRLFNNRAYPVNKPVLEAILAKRKQRAELVGFDSYAAYDIAKQMAQNPNTVEQFLRNVLMRTLEKEEQELTRIAGSNGLQEPIKPWNIAYLKEQYKKEHYALDENKLREYFPMEKTIEGLMRIYEQFFGLRFVRVPSTCLWHDDVYALEVYSQKDNVLLGIFILDLYPRPNKFSHAAHITLVPAVTLNHTNCVPEISVVMANFPRSTADAPSLLSRSDVRTFFHEFGHAIHALLGRTSIASFSGTGVKLDFVEMPSQMLEEWLWNPDILRMLSSHYKTGEPLSDDVITQITNLKQFDAAMQIRNQGRYALLSLYVHQHDQLDLDALMYSLHTTYAPHVMWDPENHFYASFGHLTDYSAKYYGYLWSKVFALDLFGEIKKTGLLDTATGRRYADMILAPGGSKPPHLLLQAFLGREPRIDAFIKDIGL